MALLSLANISAWAAETPSEVPAPEVRVVTWNLEWFPGRSPKSDQSAKDAQIGAVRAALAEMKPDILLLQEVRDEASVRLALEDLPGMETAVFSKFEGDQQVAVFTQLPIHSAWSEVWERSGSDDPPRGFDFAAIQLPGAEKHLLLTYTFHFKSNRGGDKQLQSNIAKREAASRQLGQHIEKMLPKYIGEGKLSWIMGGDFNTSLDDPKFESEQTLRKLQEGGLKWVFEGVPAGERETLPAEGQYPAATFDHILYRDLELVSTTVPTQYPAASDHRPILAVFRVPAPEPVAEEKAPEPVKPESPAP